MSEIVNLNINFEKDGCRCNNEAAYIELESGLYCNNCSTHLYPPQSLDLKIKNLIEYYTFNIKEIKKIKPIKRLATRIKVRLSVFLMENVVNDLKRILKKDE